MYNDNLTYSCLSLQKLVKNYEENTLGNKPLVWFCYRRWQWDLGGMQRCQLSRSMFDFDKVIRYLCRP